MNDELPQGHPIGLVSMWIVKTRFLTTLHGGVNFRGAHAQLFRKTEVRPRWFLAQEFKHHQNILALHLLILFANGEHFKMSCRWQMAVGIG
jgi:hypothetical protein